MQGVASCDIKLENILVTDAMRPWPVVKLADFGLSTACGYGCNALGTVGTPNYMAPEVMLAGVSQQPYDAAVS